MSVKAMVLVEFAWAASLEVRPALESGGEDRGRREDDYGEGRN